MAKTLPPNYEEREEFLRRITSGSDQGPLRLQQFIEQALCHLAELGSLRHASRVTDCALTTERELHAASTGVKEKR